MDTTESNCSSSKEYKVRCGAIDLGRDYEYKIVTLLSLRCLLEDFEDIWIAFNADGVGVFDDVVLRVQNRRGETFSYLVQLKHKDRPKNITKQEFLAEKGDFSLFKYYNEIVKLKKSIEKQSSKIIKDRFI